MLPMPPEEILKEQKNIVRISRASQDHLLDSSAEIFSILFPVATVHAGVPEKSKDASALVRFKVERMKAWISNLYEQAVEQSMHAEPLDTPPEPMRLTLEMSKEVISCLLRIFTCGRDLSEADLYFVADATEALGLKPSEVQPVIDQAQYEIRKTFFQVLVERLDARQSLSSAVLLMKAIEADEEIHPAEFRYLENITQLLGNDQCKVEEVARLSKLPVFPRVYLEEDLAKFMLKYLTEIVMSDGVYDERESILIQEVGTAFGFDKTMQDEIIQPVAAALMVKAALFPKVAP